MTEASTSTAPVGADMEQAMVRSLWWGSLIIFGAMCLGALLLVPAHSAISVAVGGAVALANFRILGRSIKKAIRPGRRQGVMGGMLLKYYLRFAATAVLLWILVRQGWVEPLGLLVGLSVVVVSIAIWGAIQARKLYKEAF